MQKSREKWVILYSEMQEKFHLKQGAGRRKMRTNSLLFKNGFVILEVCSFFVVRTERMLQLSSEPLPNSKCSDNMFLLHFYYKK